jgi:hypothetical protein
LAVLEHIDAAVAQAVLVAGYCTQPNTEDEPVLQAGYDWAAIKAHVRDARHRIPSISWRRLHNDGRPDRLGWGSNSSSTARCEGDRPGG